jgi:hypothetical protein
MPKYERTPLINVLATTLHNVKDVVVDLESKYQYKLVSSSSAMYTVSIGKKHSCQCLDYSKSEGNDLCKHIIWTLLYICYVPEDSELLHQVHLTEAECLDILNNTPPVPEGLKYIPGSRQLTRKETVTSLFMNDRRNHQPKHWILKRKDKQSGSTPRCRGCRKEQNDGELCITVVGLYIPFEQNVIVETTSYFCPSVLSVRRIPQWINLKPPDGIQIDSSFSHEETQNLKNMPLGNLLLG